jgi:alkylhydroperoxidase family enzyme
MVDLAVDLPTESTSADSRLTMTLADAAPELAAAQMAFQNVAYPGVVDLVSRELLRVLSGRLSHCRTCQNLRLNAAVKRGFDEDMIQHLEDPEHGDFSQRQVVLLRLTRLFLTDPDAFSDDDRAELLRTFSPEEVAELLLDLVRFRPGSKALVASGRAQDHDELVYV